ncbi:MAG: asparagine synthase-related protein [Candidatus Contendobacter sp.]|nr:asparagine synthase-related protein [Candidatus Contendobacter sp.]
MADGVAIAIQTLGWDASLAQHEHWVVAFHGFVGNWSDLARARGLSLAGVASDAGRVAVFFARFGEAMFPWLRGEFALLIIDRKEQAVVAVRDVIGTRPLFHQVKDGLLFVASEIRQVRAGSNTPPTMNKVMMASYLLYRPIQQDLTLDQSVSRVMPGHVWRCAAMNPEAAPQVQAYWTPPPTSESRRYDLNALAEELRALLEQAVTRATPSHPFAVTLSGGLDSGTIWALVAEHAAQGDANAALGIPYSLVFPGMECDESVRIAAMRAKTGATQYVEINAAQADLLEYLESILDRVDGCVDMTSYHVSLLARQVAMDGRATLLTGLGDEWITGSFRYLTDDLLAGHWWTVLKALARATPYRVKGSSRWRRLLNESGLGRLFRWRWLFPKVCPALYLVQERELLSPKGNNIGRLTQSSRARRSLDAVLLLAQSTLPNEPNEQLAASDCLELRHPLNDLDLVEFGFRTPPRVFTGGIREKQLLRMAVADLLAPDLRELVNKTLFDEVALSYISAVLADSASVRWVLVQQGLVNELALDSMREQAARWYGTEHRDEQNKFYSNEYSNLLTVSRLYLREQVARKFSSQPWRK